MTSLDLGPGLGVIDQVKLRAIVRLGRTTYARVREALNLQQPVWNGDVEEEYKKLISNNQREDPLVSL